MYNFAECKFSNVLLNESVTGKSSKDNVKTTLPLPPFLIPPPPHAKTAGIYIRIVNYFNRPCYSYGANEAGVDIVWYSPSPLLC